MAGPVIAFIGNPPEDGRVLWNQGNRPFAEGRAIPLPRMRSSGYFPRINDWGLGGDLDAAWGTADAD
jgi:hypothetical protein